ncbi:MAG TPA: cupin [Ferruginibacter sp.]|jgi:uncharacterized protein YjlB|nr:cupin [Ferruginibacter sp.]
MPLNRIINTNPEIRSFNFKVNKHFPNNKLPLLIYKNAFTTGAQQKRVATAVQKILNRNNWKNAWTNGIYTFHHYHSNTHECLAIIAGTARVIFGGTGGKNIRLEQSDLVIIPAGLAHKCTRSSKDFLCVGAYPGGAQYDINLGTKEEFDKARPRIKKLPTPASDPLFGKEGFLKTFWK